MIDNRKKPIAWNELVSVIFILDGDPETASNIFKYAFEQTYKNIEYVFIHDDKFNLEEFKTKINDKTDIDISVPVKYVQTIPNAGMIDAGLKECTGKVIFIKSSYPNIWYPNHIISHLRQHQSKHFKTSFCLSHYEIRAVEEPLENPFATFGYRITKKIDPTHIQIDEVSFTSDINPSFKDFVTYVDKDNKFVAKGTDGAVEVYDPSKLVQFVLTKTGSIQFADEISILSLEASRNRQGQQLLQQPNWPNDQLFQVVEDNFDVRNCIPTIFGNTQLDAQWNNKMREHLTTMWDEIKQRENQKIIVKRTIGMGDVIQTSGFISFLSKEFPKAEIWFVTSNTRGCKEIANMFTNKPHKVLTIDEHYMLADMLGYDNLPKLLEENKEDRQTIFDIRIDLDLAYESRPNTPFAKAYYDVLKIEETSENYTIEPQLNPIKYLADNQVMVEAGEYYSCCVGGSGWPGKELNVNDIKKVLESLKKNNVKLYHVSALQPNHTELANYFDKINVENDFNVMVSMIHGSIGYIGSDNGPMHIASSDGKKIFTWNGAILAEMSLGKKEENGLVILKHNELQCLGCKSKTFYTLYPHPERPEEMSISFVPQCSQPKDKYHICMKDFSQDDIDNKVEIFLQ